MLHGLLIAVPCRPLFIMGILHHIKVNINRLEQKSGMIISYTQQRSDLQSKFRRSDILKQSVSEMGIKLHRIFQIIIQC